MQERKHRTLISPRGSAGPRSLQAWRGQAFGIGIAALLAVQKAHRRRHREPMHQNGQKNHKTQNGP